jgi:diguanylate cyclase (GGDEF)-like protein
VIGHATRIYDNPGRWGGEEFLVLLPEADFEQTKMVAERIRSSIETMVVMSDTDQEIHLTISLGFGSFFLQRDWVEIEPLISAVDQALYQAKANGRNIACAVPADAIPQCPGSPAST